MIAEERRSCSARCNATGEVSHGELGRSSENAKRLAERGVRPMGHRFPQRVGVKTKLIEPIERNDIARRLWEAALRVGDAEPLPRYGPGRALVDARGL